MANAVNEAGNRYGKLLVERLKSTKGSVWICRCDCGRQCEVIGQTLREGRARGCEVCDPRRKTVRSDVRNRPRA